MLFSVKITAADGEVIELGKADRAIEKNIITALDIKLDTVDDNVRKRSNAILAKIVIKGTIDPEDKVLKDELVKIFKWAYDSSDEKWYRKLDIEIKISEVKPLRKYVFENIFVVDYQENYQTDGSNGAENKSEFVLNLTQRENCLDTIDTF